MATNFNRPPTPGPATVSLVRGGPFYRAQQAVRLIRPNKWNLIRRITFIVAVGWFPLQLHSADFHEKWILHRAEQEDEFLQAPEISALADYGNAYENIEQLKPFPADKGTLYGLAAAVVIPALPVILAEVPVAVVLKDLLAALR